MVGSVETLRTYLHTLGVEVGLAESLLQMATHDDTVIAAQLRWSRLIPQLGEFVGVPQNLTSIFDTAWSLLYAAIRRLDQLQDNDPLDDPLLGACAPAIRYNLVLTLYLLSSSYLAELDRYVAPERLQQLRLLWHSSLFRAANGQQQDLLTHAAAGYTPQHIEDYQHIAHAKSGPFFALAFGGMAILAGYSANDIATMQQIGDLYGGLVQYLDDLIDRDLPGSQSMLATMLMHMRPDLTAHDSALEQFFIAIVQAYKAHIVRLLTTESPICQPMLNLFTETFVCHLHLSQHD